MGGLRGKLRKVWDISWGRYWSDFVILGSGLNIFPAYSTRPPARSVEVHEIHLPDT